MRARRYGISMRILHTLLLWAILAATVMIGGSAIHDQDAVVAGGQGRLATVWTPIREEQLSHGRFENFTVYMPSGIPKGFVLLLSGTEGWNERMADMARHLAQKGAMIAGIDVARFDAKLEADGAECVFPDGDLENLSHFVQAYYRLPAYLTPVLSGYSAGATLAYAALAQAPANTFAGAISMQFCAEYASPKHFCKSSGLDYTPHARDGGVDFLPSKQLSGPWKILQIDDESRTAEAAADNVKTCDIEAVRSFAAKIPSAQLITVQPNAWEASYTATADTLLAQDAPASPANTPHALGDLPLVLVAAQPGAEPSDTFAIMLSGDGGWAGLDKDVATALAAEGIAVVGLDSLRYFWSARTPQGLATDLNRMIDYYSAKFGKQRVVLIGYSQGADVLPFAVNRLQPQIRRRVALAAIMGMSEHALFEFHMASWISDDESGPPTLPEVNRISGIPVLCIYGAEENDSLCPQLNRQRFTVVKLSGGHHFDGNYSALARTIIESAKNQPPRGL